MIIIGGNNAKVNGLQDVLLLNKNPLLSSPVANHPDMNMCKIDNTIFLPKNSQIKEQAISLNYSVFEIQERLGSKYPQDVCLNCLSIGNTVIMNKSTVSADILKYCEANNKAIINVSQGYANCAILALNENAFITSDKGVAKILLDYKKRVLLIKEGYIEIEEYDYGFIGGCSGFIDGVLYFSGNIEAHPDFKKIEQFLKSENIDYKCLNGKLTDVGGIVQI